MKLITLTNASNIAILTLLIICATVRSQKAPPKKATKPSTPENTNATEIDYCSKIEYQTQIGDEKPIGIGKIFRSLTKPMIYGSKEPKPDDPIIGELGSNPQEYRKAISKQFPNSDTYTTIMTFMPFIVLVIGLVVIFGRCCIGFCGGTRIQGYGMDYTSNYSLYIIATIVALILFVIIVVLDHIAVGNVRNAYSKGSSFHLTGFKDLKGFINNTAYGEICELTKPKSSNPANNQPTKHLVENHGIYYEYSLQKGDSPEIQTLKEQHTKSFTQVLAFEKSTIEFEDRGKWYSSLGTSTFLLRIALFFSYIAVLLIICGLLYGLMQHDENVDPRQRGSNMPGNMLLYGCILAWLFVLITFYALSNLVHFNILGNAYTCNGYRDGVYTFMDKVAENVWAPKKRPENMEFLTVSRIYEGCKEEGTSLSKLKITSSNNSNQTSSSSKNRLIGDDTNEYRVLYAEQKLDPEQNNSGNETTSNVTSNITAIYDSCHQLYVIIESGTKTFCLGYIDGIDEVTAFAIIAAIILALLAIAAILLSKYYLIMEEIILDKEDKPKKPKIKKKKGVKARKAPPPKPAAPSTAAKEVQTYNCVVQQCDDNAAIIRVIQRKEDDSCSYSEHKEILIKIPEELGSNEHKPRQNIEEILDIKIPLPFLHESDTHTSSERNINIIQLDNYYPLKMPDEMLAQFPGTSRIQLITSGECCNSGTVIRGYTFNPTILRVPRWPQANAPPESDCRCTVAPPASPPVAPPPPPKPPRKKRAPKRRIRPRGSRRRRR